ncbi:MAG: TatD family hydrolase [Natronospirillum sp.]
MAKMDWSDSHCHLDFPAFDQDRRAVLAACAARDVRTIIVPGVRAAQWRSLFHWLSAEQDELGVHVWGAAGLHPYFMAQHQMAHLTQLDEFLAQNPVVAVGEIGLDGTVPDMANQLAYLEAQLELAQHHRLPVILHQHQAHNELLKALKRTPPVGGVVHAFSGSVQMAQEYIGLGLRLGVGGVMTYERAKRTRQAFQTVPLSALLLETDSPDMPLTGFQGVRNSPVQIPAVFRALCRLRDETNTDAAAQQLMDNLKATFPALG